MNNLNKPTSPNKPDTRITRDQAVGFDGGSFREKKIGKGMFHAIPAESLKRLAQRYEVGPLVYDVQPNSWREGFPQTSFLDSAMRHLVEYMEGDNSEDHLAAVAWNVFGAMWMEMNKPEWMDIETRKGLPVTDYTKYAPYTDKPYGE